MNSTQGSKSTYLAVPHQAPLPKEGHLPLGLQANDLVKTSHYTIGILSTPGWIPINKTSSLGWTPVNDASRHFLPICGLPTEEEVIDVEMEDLQQRPEEDSELGRATGAVETGKQFDCVSYIRDHAAQTGNPLPERDQYFTTAPAPIYDEPEVAVGPFSVAYGLTSSQRLTYWTAENALVELEMFPEALLWVKRYFDRRHPEERGPHPQMLLFASDY